MIERTPNKYFEKLKKKKVKQKLYYVCIRMMMMTAVAKLLTDRWMDEWFSGMRLVIITHTLQCGGPKTSETDGV